MNSKKFLLVMLMIFLFLSLTILYYCGDENTNPPNNTTNGTTININTADAVSLCRFNFYGHQNTPLELKVSDLLTSSNTVSSYYWDFEGNGTAVLASANSPDTFHTYDTIKTYKSILVIKYADNTQELKYINVIIQTSNNAEIPRVVVWEDFTATWCIYCKTYAKPALTYLEKAVPSLKNMALLAYHATSSTFYPSNASDYNTTYTPYETSYAVSGYPQNVVDGDVGEPHYGNVLLTYKNYYDTYSEQKVIEPKMWIDGENFFDATSKEIEVDFFVTVPATLNVQDTAIRVAIFENDLADPTGLVWQEVIRKMSTISIPTTNENGKTYRFSYKYTLEKSFWNPIKMGIAIFGRSTIQSGTMPSGYTGSTLNAYPIYQGWARMLDGSTGGTQTIVTDPCVPSGGTYNEQNDDSNDFWSGSGTSTTLANAENTSIALTNGMTSPYTISGCYKYHTQNNLGWNDGDLFSFSVTPTVMEVWVTISGNMNPANVAGVSLLDSAGNTLTQSSSFNTLPITLHGYIKQGTNYIKTYLYQLNTDFNESTPYTISFSASPYTFLSGENCDNLYSPALTVGTNAISSSFGAVSKDVLVQNYTCFDGVYSGITDTIFPITIASPGSYLIRFNKTINNLLTAAILDSCTTGTLLGCNYDYSINTLLLDITVTSAGTYYLVIGGFASNSIWPDTAFNTVIIESANVITSAVTSCASVTSTATSLPAVLKGYINGSTQQNQWWAITSPLSAAYRFAYYGGYYTTASYAAYPGGHLYPGACANPNIATAGNGWQLSCAGTGSIQFNGLATLTSGSSYYLNACDSYSGDISDVRVYIYQP